MKTFNQIDVLKVLTFDAIACSIFKLTETFVFIVLEKYPGFHPTNDAFSTFQFLRPLKQFGCFLRNNSVKNLNNGLKENPFLSCREIDMNNDELQTKF